ncbi:MAG TPA: hypothetical protein VF086_16055 [Propionibacteriaceae bacterium]
MLFTALRSKAVDPPGGWAFIAADARSAAALITRSMAPEDDPRRPAPASRALIRRLDDPHEVDLLRVL